MADLELDGKKVARLDYKARFADLQKRPALVFDVPASTRRLQLRGTLTDRSGKQWKFCKVWTVRNLAPLTAPLYDHNRPWLDRVRAVSEHSEGLTVRPLTQRPGQDGAADQDASFKRIEQWLGRPVPPVLRTLGTQNIEVRARAVPVAAGDADGDGFTALPLVLQAHRGGWAE